MMGLSPWWHPVLWLLFHGLRWHRLNALYADVEPLEGRPFLQALLDWKGTKIQCPIPPDQVMPSTGSCILLANHPTGALDGLSLLHQVLAYRSDVKIMGQSHLNLIPPLEPWLLPVQPIKGHGNPLYQSGKSLKKAQQWLRDGHVVIAFPAADIAALNLAFRIKEKPWSVAALRWIQVGDVTVIPVGVKAVNRRRFYLFAWMGKGVRHALAVGEWLANKRPVAMTLNLGEAIELNEASDMKASILALQQQSDALAHQV
ncbi:MAG: hypothetical protein MUQ40_02845 [Schleiferiaceae bacterium]|nr:hypothetical protein [Schleiferiaceae bacterium]